MKEAIANLAHSAKKSFGLSVLLLFIMFASAHAQTVDKDNARIDTLITKICKSVPGLKGIATATPKDIQTLYNNACVAIAYGIYPNEFQKIKDTCMKAKAQDGAIDTTTALTPEQEKKILVPLSVAASNQTITDIRKKNGLGTSNEDLDKATLPQLEAALADIKTQCPTVDAPAAQSTTGAVPVDKPAFGNKDIWPGISKSKLSALWTILTGKKGTQKLLAENRNLKKEKAAKDCATIIENITFFLKEDNSISKDKHFNSEMLKFGIFVKESSLLIPIERKIKAEAEALLKLYSDSNSAIPDKKMLTDMENKLYADYNLLKIRYLKNIELLNAALKKKNKETDEKIELLNTLNGVMTP